MKLLVWLTVTHHDCLRSVRRLWSSPPVRRLVSGVLISFPVQLFCPTVLTLSQNLGMLGRTLKSKEAIQIKGQTSRLHFFFDAELQGRVLPV